MIHRKQTHRDNCKTLRPGKIDDFELVCQGRKCGPCPAAEGILKRVDEAAGWQNGSKGRFFRGGEFCNCLHRHILLVAMLSCVFLSFGRLLADDTDDWTLGPFERVEEANPVLTPSPYTFFLCPMQKREVFWEKDHVFNPAAIVRNGMVYLIYRAEDDYGTGIAQHTSRLGIAESSDGIHFLRSGVPILYPDEDGQNSHEWPGGCEDPRIVETEEGTYVMTYTQWNQDIAVMGVATSADLLTWKKHGYAFEGKWGRIWSKSGSIVCQREGDRLIAAKIHGRYWMYWGDSAIYCAVSDDLISWNPLRDPEGKLLVIVAPRIGKFDSFLVEPGPGAILTDKGIVLLYNGKNIDANGNEHPWFKGNGDPNTPLGAYSAGQVLFHSNDPTLVIGRTEKSFLTPEKAFEQDGQYNEGGTVFVEGLVRFNNKWMLYYGASDSAIGVAVSKD